MHRVYSVTHPIAEKVINVTCDGTVTRFRSLAVGTCFLLGEDEETVWCKMSQTTIHNLMLGGVEELKSNPWVEPTTIVT